MRKSKFKIETLFLSLAMAANLVMPLQVKGQGRGADGFFKDGWENYENRDDVTTGLSGSITNDSFGAPVGNGLLVMAVAGIAYALRKSRTKIALMAVLALCLTQCKKEERVMPNNIRCVGITLDVGEGSKTNVDPNTGIVTFANGDEIIVANDGKYIGSLTYENGVFSGTVTNPNTDDYLHFYHLGNRSAGDLIAGESTGCTVSIADQATTLPVISYAPSTVKYSSDVTLYQAKLRNKCALVKFNVTTSSPRAGTCIVGMKNQVVVDFTDASFTYQKEGDGHITLASGSGERWAILLPQDELDEGEEGSAFSGRYKGVRGLIPEINADDKLDEGIAVTATTPFVPTGALNTLFTVNEDGKQVYFAKANLSYLKNDKQWQFLQRQFTTYEGNGTKLGDNYMYKTKVTLFGWGTSGYDHGAAFYLPYTTEVGNANFYAYGDPNNNLYDETGLADWGYNAISDGGKAYKQWRVLEHDEWVYLFSGRPGAEGKWGYATANNFQGIVVLPDEWVEPYDQCFTPGHEDGYTTNVYTLQQWNQMEAAGALIFPAAGYRARIHSFGKGTALFCWSSTSCGNGQSYCVFANADGMTTDRIDGNQQGMSVRLVCE